MKIFGGTGIYNKTTLEQILAEGKRIDADIASGKRVLADLTKDEKRTVAVYRKSRT